MLLPSAFDGPNCPRMAWFGSSGTARPNRRRTLEKTTNQENSVSKLINHVTKAVFDHVGNL